MENLRIYRVHDRYIWFLKSRDSKVQDNKNKKRPYVGVVLTIGKYKYFVPMESPKASHANMKNSRHIMKIDGGKYGILGFNNMIPIPDSALISFDINQEEAKYANLLKNQLRYINKNKVDVMDHASKTYYQVVTVKNAFMISICCDFVKLEKACDQYDPNRPPKK